MTSLDAATRRRRATIRRSPPTPTVEVDDVSVWFGPKVALSELSCSFGPGVTGLLGPNGAGKTTLMRAITGLVGVNQGTRARSRAATRAATARCTPAWRWCPRTKPCRPGSPPASSSATSPTCTASPTAARPTHALRTVGMLDVADRRVDDVQQGHAPAHQGRRRARDAIRTCSCSTSR